MASQIVMPRMGLTMDEGTLVGWRKAEGQKVTAGEPLFEIETDKSTVEVEASETGVLGKILFPVGATVPVGTVIAILVKEGEALPADETPAAMPIAAGPAAAPVDTRAGLRKPCGDLPAASTNGAAQAKSRPARPHADWPKSWA